MKANNISYDYEKSFERIDRILNESNNSFEELDSIPSREKLTYNNGFYVNCSALFVDIRESSSLPQKHNRPKLAKLYRSYISEIVAIMNGNSCCNEINIIGDCVSGMFDTPYISNINSVFDTAARISSLIDVMNFKFDKKCIEQIKVGIGISYGRALMIKAGYSGSSINDVVWMGKVVNEASKLANAGEKDYGEHRIIVSDIFYENLKLEYQNFFNKYILDDYFHCNVHNIGMNKWYEKNCC